MRCKYCGKDVANYNNHFPFCTGVRTAFDDDDYEISRNWRKRKKHNVSAHERKRIKMGEQEDEDDE